MNGTTNETLEQHLMFHKALIDDNCKSEKIDKYLKILKEEPDCERMQDPVDESIRTVFRLVLDEGLDPWSIDLREFVRTYSAKVNATVRLDIIVAGKLVLMAWKVLRMQTDVTRMESDRPDDEIYDMEDFPYFTDFEEPTLYIPGISLRETYARTPQRPVTMLELLDAFEEAREEINASIERERVREQLRAKEPKVFDNKAHKEVSESDVEAVWQRIQRIGTGAFSLTDLFVPNIDDNITVFLSVLQLVRDGKISIWQNELPYGDVMVEIKVDWISGRLEDAEVPAKVPEAVI